MLQLSLFEDSRRRRPWLPSDHDHVVAVPGDLVKDLDLRPPVNVELVLSYLGVRNVVREAIPWSGLLFEEEGQLTVAVKSTDSWPRQRFSMLHEGGHTFLPGFRRVPQYRCSPGAAPAYADRSAEILSDVAASELLFPRPYFLADTRARPTFCLVEEIARCYEASIKASALHLVALSPVDALVVALEVALKPSQQGHIEATPELRVQWSASRGDWLYVPRHKGAVRGGPLYRALDGETVEADASPGEICETDETMHLSARRYTHITADGLPKTQVLALYSRSWSKIRVGDD